jgi:hypothetical protein
MKYLVYIGAVIGTICLLLAFTANGAPQQAALAGMACAFAVIPYVLFRVGQIVEDGKERREFYQQVRGRMQDVVDSIEKNKA